MGPCHTGVTSPAGTPIITNAPSHGPRGGPMLVANRWSHPRGNRHLTEGSTTGWWAPRTLAVSMPVLREEPGPHAHAGRRRGSTRTQEARVVVFGDRPSSRW